MKKVIKASMGRYDDYFGESAAAEYSDDIIATFKGWKISKRVDLSEEYDPTDKFAGLIAAADVLGMEDFYDFLEALEGMCYEGTAVEIDDSTYEILSHKMQNNMADIIKRRRAERRQNN